MIEIFCTDIGCTKAADGILSKIREAFPCYKANFDLEDCDRILRVESPDTIDSENLIALIQTCGFSISILPDFIYPEEKGK